jgi:two-component system cell cycle sensor histidine kinase/response regulator CckA
MTAAARTVLLVEDEPSVLVSLETAMTQNGWHVLTAVNGQDALLLFDQHQTAIDVVVSDVDLPGLSGPLLAQQILQKRPDLAILFMSGAAGVCARSLTNGCSNQGFLQKPFMLAEFFAELQRLVP